VDLGLNARRTPFLGDGAVTGAGTGFAVEHNERHLNVSTTRTAMKKLNFATLALTLLASASSLATNLSSIATDTPIAQKGDQALYMYSGVDIRNASEPCWLLLQVRNTNGRLSVNGVMDPLYHFPSFDKQSEESMLFHSSVTQSYPRQIDISVGVHGFYSRGYELIFDSTGKLTSFTESGHDRMLEMFANDDAVEDFKLQCVSMKNVSARNEIKSEFALKNINEFEVSAQAKKPVQKYVAPTKL
jgi:ribosomal protein L31